MDYSSKNKIYTLNGTNILNSSNAFEPSYFNVDMVFKLDLSENNIYRNDFINSFGLHDSNALFYQLNQITDSLETSLVFIDFNMMFNSIKENAFPTANEIPEDSKNVLTDSSWIDEEKNEENTYEDMDDYQQYLSSLSDYGYYMHYIKDGYPIEDLAEWEMNMAPLFTQGYFKGQSIDIKLRILFDNGILLSFDGKEYLKFIPFDKSQSMSRQSRISFIREDMVDLVNKRLLLGMDFSRIPLLSLSKFYAYKGLYLSSGQRMNCVRGISVNDITSSFGKNYNPIILNEKTFIVINDSVCNNSCSAIMAKPVSSIKNGDNNTVSGYLKYELYESPNTSLSINSFDGQGIISCEYASLIDEKASSLQIRMPFIKGMVHAVDFHDFIRQFRNESIVENIDSDYMITDMFGIKRNILEAQIIITQSMFKGAEWIHTFVANNTDKTIAKDPMEFFFNAFYEYDHSMYISCTDSPYRNRTLIPINYQFLNTLCFNKEEMHQLYLEHISKTDNLIDYLKRSKSLPADIFHDGELNHDWVQIVLKNNNFANDPYVKTQLQNIKNYLKKEIAFGRFVVDGTIRYLSGDLLFFLGEMLLNPNDRNSAKYDLLRQEYLKDYHFYLPEDSDNSQDKNRIINPGTFYTFLRNPHLSRNEQCLLKAWDNPAAQTSLYKTLNENDSEVETNTFDYSSIREKYLSHLSGAVMVAHDSLAPNILGGADFDGDVVKIISSEAIINKVKSTVYEDDCITRRLPIILIPNPLGSQKMAYHNVNIINYDVIKNTFSNKIGKLSNISARIGKKQYTSNIKNVADDLCAQCTIYTGLEIDAAKNGCRADITDFMEKSHNTLTKDDYDYLNSFNTVFCKILSHEGYFSTSSVNPVCSKGQHSELSSGIYKGESKTLEYIYKPGMVSLDLLPYFFFLSFTKKETASQNEKYSNNTSKSGINSRFPFYKTYSKNISGDSETITNAYSIIESYRYVRMILNKVQRNYRYCKTANTENIITGIFHNQYQDSDTATYNFEKCKKALMQCLKTPSDIDAAITRLRESEWPYLTKENNNINKKECLKKIIFVDNCASDKINYVIEACTPLFDFSNHGYQLLFLFLTRIKNELLVNNPLELIEISLKKEAANNESLNINDDNKYFEKMIKELRLAFTEIDFIDNISNKLITTSVERKLIKKCQYILKSIIPDERERFKTVVYLTAKSKYHRFLWDMYDADTILKYSEGI